MAQITIVLHYLSIVVFCLATLHAAISDARTLEIANGVSIAIVLAFLPAAIITGLPMTALALHFGIAGLIFAGGVLLYANGLAGGGDVKFLAAVCVWWDTGNLGKYLVLVALLGGVLGICIILAGRFEGIRRIVPWLSSGKSMKQPIPYGIAIAGAVFLMFNTLPVLPAGLVDFLK